jgi:outer membrane protein OmpA-like peptidoglycan-associated protein
MYETEVDADSYYVVKAMKDTYLDDCLTFRTTNTDPEVRDLLLERYEVNQVFTIENIYYDLDKWYIRPDAEKELDKLVRIMKEQPITIELSSHTDCRASDQYNIDLSQKRAESAVRYLVLNGISPARMTAKGYGETMLVNRCADGVSCTEEEHQQNRRTEFKITSIMEDSEGIAQSLDRFKEGDLLSLFFFDRDFFANCYNGRQESFLEKNPPGIETEADNITPTNNEAPPIVQSSEDSDEEIPEKAYEPVKEAFKEEIKEDVMTPKKDKAEKEMLVIGKYTVQIAAGTQLTRKLKAVEGLYQCVGKDGISRFLVGVFDNVNDAVPLRNKMRNDGFADAWVVKIDENRSNCLQIN